MAKQTNYIAKTPDANGVINYSEEEHSVWSQTSWNFNTTI